MSNAWYVVITLASAALSLAIARRLVHGRLKWQAPSEHPHCGGCGTVLTSTDAAACPACAQPLTNVGIIGTHQMTPRKPQLADHVLTPDQAARARQGGRYRAQRPLPICMRCQYPHAGSNLSSCPECGAWAHVDGVAGRHQIVMLPPGHVRGTMFSALIGYMGFMGYVALTLPGLKLVCFICIVTKAAILGASRLPSYLRHASRRRAVQRRRETSDQSDIRSQPVA